MCEAPHGFPIYSQNFVSNFQMSISVQNGENKSYNAFSPFALTCMPCFPLLSWQCIFRHFPGPCPRPLVCPGYLSLWSASHCTLCALKIQNRNFMSQEDSVRYCEYVCEHVWVCERVWVCEPGLFTSAIY